MTSPPADAQEPIVSLRRADDSDLPFLQTLYASTREEELAQTDWNAEQKARFLAMQFDAQHAHYQQHFAKADFQVIVFGGSDIGRLYVWRDDAEIRIVDIALLPEFRRQGIGTRLLRQLLAEANDCGKPVRIHVECNNPARQLYERLGFRCAEDKGVYLLMQRTPNP